MHSINRALLLAVILWSNGSHLTGAQQERPLLLRPTLREVVLADFAQGIGSAASRDAKALLSVTAGRCEVTFPAREDAAQVALRSGAPIDLTGLDILRLDIENVGTERVTAVLSLATATPGAARWINEQLLEPGTNAIALPIWAMLDEQGAVFDKTKVTDISLAVKRCAHPAVLRVNKIAAQQVFADTTRMRFYDFGDGTLATGAAPVKSDTVYDATRGYGLVNSNTIEMKTWQTAFALLGDGLTGKDISFRVNVPEGEYEAQVVGFGTNWMGARCVSYRITADGVALVDEQITPERFRSYELQYYGANLFFDPQRTLFDQYHRGYFAPHRFNVFSKAGAITLHFEGANPRALWIYPKSQVAEGRALVDACFAEEGHRLWQREARVRDHTVQADTVAPSAADRARGYTLFSRDPQRRVYPNQGPKIGEIVTEVGMSVACAPGEFEPVTLVIRPLQDLGNTTISFTTPTLHGAVSPIEIRQFFIKYLPIQVDGMWYEATPSLLYPYTDRTLTKDWNCQYWATIRVPKGTPAGDYSGAITITPAVGQATTVPVKLVVHPFELPKTTTECGMWNCGPWSNHQVGAFPSDDALVDQLLAAETTDMAEHGLNGYQFISPDAKAVDLLNQRLPLDFSKYDRIATALKRSGMSGRHSFNILNLANYQLIKKGVAEFSPEFNRIYIGIMTELRDWMRAKEVKGVLQVTDECRETELNDWNRNRVDTLKHLRLARQVEGLQLMVTLMGDTDAFNRPYTPLIPLMDVLSCHSWPKADDQIFLTTVEKMADLWSYNNGFTRFAFGFHLWKSQALGHWQWVYSWESCDAHIPVLMSGDPSAAYAVPGGYLDTVKFENVREGIDDHRYIELLTATLAEVGGEAPAATDARKFLATLEAFLPMYPHNTGLVTGAEAGASWDESAETAYFIDWRAQMVEYISALKSKRAAKRLPSAWVMFPQALVAEQRSLVCTMVNSAPVIDGKGDDAIWSQAAEAGNFLNLARGIRASNQTTVKMLCDGKRLYALLTCTEPKYGELKAYAIARDDQCWEDDAIELFLDTRNDKTTYKHIIVNCLGTIQDSDTRDGLWNGDITTAAVRGKGVWTVELSVGLESLGGLTPKAGVTWGANVCRDRQPQPMEVSSWAFVGNSFHNPQGFGSLVFSP